MGAITMGALATATYAWIGAPVARHDAGGATTHATTPAPPGPVDVGFAQDMSLHHEQALVMARLALAQGSPRVRTLAQGIVNQQLREIGTLQGWLMLWEQPALSPRDDMQWMRDAYARSTRRDASYDRFIENCLRSQGMPGQATPEELQALEDSPGAEAFDIAFLRLMIRHHQGAVVMARFTAEHAASGVVQGVARAIAAEQQQELGRMAVWLRGMAGQGRP